MKMTAVSQATAT